jgi:predicted PurR-regulated permease PerM
MDNSGLNKIVALILVLFTSVVFFIMIRGFIITLILAAIFSAMAQPFYRRLVKWCRGRKTLASSLTLALIFLIIVMPLLGLLGIVAGQAIQISNSVKPWVDQISARPSVINEWLSALPFYDSIASYQNEILQKGGEIVGTLSSLLFKGLSAVTMSTINSIFLFFVLLYTMFFFIKDGDTILVRILSYLPLQENVERRMLARFTSIARATIKGSLVIGIIQGSLAGAAFWVVGIDGAVFWGTVMTVLSVIPAVGAALVWLPAVLILAITGQYVQAIGLLAFCSLLVSTIDNLLRPWLVGKDTELHELMIFLGTLGGIGLFGIIGFIIGPIVAGLFVTAWDICAENFPDKPTEKNV